MNGYCVNFIGRKCFSGQSRLRGLPFFEAMPLSRMVRSSLEEHSKSSFSPMAWLEVSPRSNLRAPFPTLPAKALPAASSLEGVVATACMTSLGERGEARRLSPGRAASAFTMEAVLKIESVHTERCTWEESLSRAGAQVCCAMNGY
jgi:hypothetical protein